MPKRFEKKETDKSEIKQEEKKISVGKAIAGIGTVLLGAAVLVFTNGKHGGSTKS